MDMVIDLLTGDVAWNPTRPQKPGVAHAKGVGQRDSKEKKRIANLRSITCLAGESMAQRERTNRPVGPRKRITTSAPHAKQRSCDSRETKTKLYSEKCM